jgi:hypothetical protein
VRVPASSKATSREVVRSSRRASEGESSSPKASKMEPASSCLDVFQLVSVLTTVARSASILERYSADVECDCEVLPKRWRRFSVRLVWTPCHWVSFARTTAASAPPDRVAGGVGGGGRRRWGRGRSDVGGAEGHVGLESIASERGRGRGRAPDSFAWRCWPCWGCRAESLAVWAITGRPGPGRGVGAAEGRAGACRARSAPPERGEEAVDDGGRGCGAPLEAAAMGLRFGRASRRAAAGRPGS